jgi:hypothetical protein
VLRRQTARDRLRRSLQRITVWCRHYRHQPVRWQHQHLASKLRGHYAYYGITGNLRRLCRFRYEVQRVWRKWLARRSQRTQMPWERFNRLLVRYPLP